MADEKKPDPQKSKEFVTQLMSKSDREQGRIPRTRLHDELAQQLLTEAAAGEQKHTPAPPKQPEPGVKSVQVDDGEFVDIITHTPEETAAMRKRKRARDRKLASNPKLKRQFRYLMWLKRFPEYKADFRALNYWMSQYPIEKLGDPHAKAYGIRKANEITERLLSAACKHPGAPKL